MITPLAQSPKDLAADICIIGAGAAGITLARKLSGGPARVILCEAGGLEYSDESQSIYQGRTEGDEYYDLEVARLRYFGGTTNAWTGWCRPLDSYDFHAKNGNALTAWPITIDALNPYLDETRQLLQVTAGKDEGELGSSGFKRVAFEFSPPVQFGEAYKAMLEQSETVQVLLNANLVGADHDGARITAVRVKDYDGNERLIRAHYVVLACGGIENSRLLLWLQQSGHLPPAANSDLVGRYWMEHPHAPVGDLVITAPDKFKFNKIALDFFAPTREFMERHNTLNCQLYVKSSEYGDARKVVADLLCTAPSLGKWVMQQVGKDLACVAQIKAAWEQEPVAENRVELGAERDKFGIPRPILRWKRSSQDMRTIRETAIAFAKYCASADIGRAKLADWVFQPGNAFPKFDEMGGHHHMGGTRMAESADTGVVDANCRMFGSNNLYIAGSSVFPSVGHANPTFSIVQLALRLADHLDILVRTKA